MAKLTRKPVSPPEYLTVNDHPQANTPAQVYHHYLFLRSRYPEFLFGQGNQAGIIINVRWQPRFIRNILGQGFIACIKIGVIDAFYWVYKTGHPNTYACNFILRDT